MRAKLTAEQKRARLEDKRRQIETQLRDLAAKERQEERRRDTRRKIIAGALALEHAAKNKDAFAEKLDRLIDEYVTKPDERALFGLDPLPEGNDA